MSEMGVPQLTREWERMRLRYGITDSPQALERLLLGLRRRNARLRHLRDRHAEIQAELSVLETEMQGMEKAVRLLLNDAIERARSERGYSWSPSAVLGFRVWLIRDKGLHGYRVQWKHRSLRARCGISGTETGVPHTGDECGRPPCGIYAAKDVTEVMTEHARVDIRRLAVGLVGMTGKVVEHERGYRGEEATALALAFLRGPSLHVTDDPAEIELLFQGVGLPETELTTHQPARARVTAQLTEYLNEEKTRKGQWILGSPNEL